MPTQYFPFVVKQGQSRESIRQELLDLILFADWQQREYPRPDPLLMKAAQKKADSMADGGWFGHTSPDGITANENVRSVGYGLPDWYPAKGNNVESIAIGHSNPASVVTGWLNSPNHRVHLAGEIDFYRNQNQIGVGMAINKDKRPIWVFLSAP